MLHKNPAVVTRRFQRLENGAIVQAYISGAQFAETAALRPAIQSDIGICDEQWILESRRTRGTSICTESCGSS